MTGTVVLGAAILLLGIGSVAVRSNGEQSGLTAGIVIASIAAIAAFTFVRTPAAYALSIGVLLAAALLVPAQPTTYAQRTFYGVHRVYEDRSHVGRHVLLNGTTVHGIEDLVGPHAGEPTAYYHRTGPIGQYFDRISSVDHPLAIGVIGLGTGALAAYGRPGDRFHYYEIDRASVDIATDRRLFTYLSDSRAHVDITLGDGRLELDQDERERYDLLVIDAFSGDAIPMHLITDEALALYRRRLAPDGVIAFHISNRYFDFAPILARLAREQGLAGVIQDDVAVGDEVDQGKFDSRWVLMAPSIDDLRVASDARWDPLTAQPDAPLWTDEYSDLLHVFRWQG